MPKTKVITAQQAAGLIRDGDTLAIAAFAGGSGLAEEVCAAIEKRFLDTGKPNDLTLMVASGNGDGTTGSFALTLSTLDTTIAQWGTQGFNLGYIHRLISVGGGGLDSLPHCGAIISVLAVCGLTHKQAYFPIFVNCTVIPILVSYCIMLPIMILMG